MQCISVMSDVPRVNMCTVREEEPPSLLPSSPRWSSAWWPPTPSTYPSASLHRESACDQKTDKRRRNRNKTSEIIEAEPVNNTHNAADLRTVTCTESHQLTAMFHYKSDPGSDSWTMSKCRISVMSTETYKQQLHLHH